MTHLSPEQLTNTEWVLEDLAGTGVVDHLQTTLRFESPGRISGKGGCNRYTAAVQLEPASESAGEICLTVSGVASTKMMCVPAAMDQETRYFQAIQTAQRLKLEGAYLLVYSEGTEAPLRFTQLTTAPLKSP
ncbi:MAG TPA: META domain-containing protein [Coleofasciculaceae cyanobacterium]